MFQIDIWLWTTPQTIWESIITSKKGIIWNEQFRTDSDYIMHSLATYFNNMEQTMNDMLP